MSICGNIEIVLQDGRLVELKTDAAAAEDSAGGGGVGVAPGGNSRSLELGDVQGRSAFSAPFGYTGYIS